MAIDLKTIIFFDALVYGVGAVAAAFIWYQRPKHFAGTGYWVASMMVEAVGTVLLILRGQVPDYISIVLANVMIWSGILLFYIGLGRFLCKKSLQLHNYILLAVFAIIHLYFTYVQPSLLARNLNTNVAIIIFSVQCCWMLLWSLTPHMRGAARMVGTTFGLFAAVSLARIIMNIILPPQSNDFFKSGTETAIAFIALVLGTIILVYGMIVLVNRRIFIEALSYMKDLEIKKDLLNEAGNLMKVGGWEFDVKTHQLTWTEGVYRIYEEDLGCQPIMEKAMSFYTPESAPIMSQAVQRAIEHGEPFDLELPFVTARGNNRWVHAIGKAYRKEGNIVKVGGVFQNITERKQTEDALRNSEKRYRELADQLPQIVCETNIEGNIIFANNNAFKAFGYTREEMDSGLTILQMIEPIEQEVAKKNMLIALGGADVGGIEYNACRKDGSTFPILTYSSRIISSGKPTGLRIIAIDITERKKMEEQLRQSEERFSTVFRNTPDSITLTSLSEGRIIEVNEGFYRLTGYTTSEAIGHTVSELNLWHELADRKRFTELLQKQGRVLNFEADFCVKSGAIINTFVSAEIIELMDEKYILSVIRDITERKRLVQALVEEKKRIEVTLQSTGDGVIAADMEGKVTMLNRVAEQLTGWTQKEAAGRSVQEVFHIIDEKTRLPAMNPAQEVLKANKVVSLGDHKILVSRDGTERIIADSGAPISDEVGRVFGVVLVFRDVTHIHKLEDEVQKITKLESVGTLAGGIAHDFNNLLTAILGYVNLATRKLQDGNEVKDILQEVEKASLQARGLTQQLLTFARGGAPVKKLTDLEKLIKDAALFASHGSAIKCQFSIPDDLWHAEVDEGQLSQVISNLVINASQAMPNGGTVEINAVNITVTTKQNLGKKLPLPEGDYVRIAVVDHGVGISPRHINKIFDPYFTTKKKGSGLGLATSYSIVRKHEGYISVESKINAGSTFYIYLPASKASIKVVKEKVKKEVEVGKGRILVMDDEAAVRDVATRMLQHIGYNDVTVAVDGEETIKLYLEAMKKGKSFDLVILDLTIPGGMGGKETVKKLLEIDPQVKAVVSSGYSSESTMAEYKKYGFKGVVAKPYTLQQLGDTLHNVMM